MGWVNDALKELAAGRSVQVRPFGGSMRGRIESGQLVTVAPVEPASIQVGDVVLVQWKGNYLLHLVKEINGEQLLIGNNLGKINGWVAAAGVRGKAIGSPVVVCDLPSGGPSRQKSLGETDFKAGWKYINMTRAGQEAAGVRDDSSDDALARPSR